MVGPSSTKTSPQLPVYHFQYAPVPSEPPVTLMFVFPSEQIVDVTAVAPLGTIDEVFAATVTNASSGEPQFPVTLA